MLNPRLSRTADRLSLLIGRAPQADGPDDPPAGPDWAQAAPEWIETALEHALRKDGGGWYALERREAFSGAGPWAHTVAGRELVVWRDAGDRLLAAPEACPHLGASLASARVEEGRLVCPWHGLRLDARGFRDWRCHPVHDDGVLVWVQLDTPGETRSERPHLAPRPRRGVSATIVRTLAADPEDVLANRLDPWHGAHFHPHSFAALEVHERTLDVVRLRVVYRVVGPIGVEVDATFHCPDPRTIVMTIVDGDGVGSVVETHATPIRPGSTRLIETTIATSDRPLFQGLLTRAPRLARRVLAPFIAARADRLWADDGAYCERRFSRRQAQSQKPPFR